MNTQQKLEILSDASRYDLACACGTKNTDHRRRGQDGSWLYPVSLPGGGYSVMLKTLISNVCSNDCKYCPFRSAVDLPRCTIDPQDMASIFLDYVRAKKVFGLFLSSGVAGAPDHSMRILNDTAAILRKKHRYRGYIHLKVIPGASDAAIEETLSLASAVSLNIETPGDRHCRHLSSKKNFTTDIIRPLKLISALTRKGMQHEGVKTTTQFIVGASDETDREIVTYTSGLYERLKLHRVYFSAYQRGCGDPGLPGEQAATAASDEIFIREHRIYQADFLLRKYGFTMDDFMFDAGGKFSLEKDPKQVWVDCHPEYFPVAIGSATKAAILRIPGIGPITARNIVRQRREGRIGSWEQLGLAGKRLKQVRQYAVL
jgi:predicted DNA-binding helix-hairpin-helix protein